MEQQAPIVDELEQIRLDSIALRKELGLPGGRLTEEQQVLYLKAKTERWRAQHVRSETIGETAEHK
jgi:hypothetical protein